MTLTEAKEKLAKYGKEDLLDNFDELTEDKKAKVLSFIEKADFSRAAAPEGGRAEAAERATAPRAVSDIFVDDINEVRRIGESAFSHCDSVTKVSIPNNVSTIGDEAFAGCKALTSVIIPNSVRWIGERAFFDCTALTDVSISNSVSEIGKSAFARCTALTSVTIPDGVETIGASAFAGCTSLRNIMIPPSVREIGERAFLNCVSLKSVFYGGSQLRWKNLAGEMRDFGSQQTVVYFNCTNRSGDMFYSVDENGNVTIGRYNGAGDDISIPSVL